MELTADIRQVVTAGRLAHLVTLNEDGSPQVTLVWVGHDGDEIVTAHRADHHKLRNVRRDPRVVLSIEAHGKNPIGWDQYLVLHGHARVVEGGAGAMLAKLSRQYLPEGTVVPEIDPSAGYLMRTTVDRVGGIGPWA